MARNCAQHYGVFNDLYGRHAVFANVVDTRVEFVTAEKDEDGESLGRSQIGEDASSYFLHFAYYGTDGCTDIHTRGY